MLPIFGECESLISYCALNIIFEALFTLFVVISFFLILISMVCVFGITMGIVLIKIFEFFDDVFYYFMKMTPHQFIESKRKKVPIAEEVSDIKIV